MYFLLINLITTISVGRVTPIKFEVVMDQKKKILFIRNNYNMI